MTVKPIGDLSATTAVASAGTITCTTGGETYKFVYSLSPQGIQENGSALLKVLRKYVQEDFVHYTAKSRELDSLRLGVATADHPLGPFQDVHDRPLFDSGYAAIDGSALVCSEGNFLYYSRDCSENIVDGVKTSQIYCIRMNDDPHLWNEGRASSSSVIGTS